MSATTMLPDHPYRVASGQILEFIGADSTLEEQVAEIIHECITKERLTQYEKYRNSIVTVEVNGLAVEAIVKDVKFVNGYPEYQVTPVAGSGHIWVQKFKNVKR
jgi:hypothetical protein